MLNHCYVPIKYRVQFRQVELDLESIYGVQSTVTFVVSVSKQFKISVINTEQSSHLLIRLQMTKL
jgi:hypothetical protein